MSNRAMQATLQNSSLHVLLMLVSKALSRSGFGDVQILGRRHNRQRSALLGCELLCQAELGFVPVKVIVKIARDTIRVRMLDELAGAITRTGADIGLLVTPFSVKAESMKAQAKYRRVEILDGDAFASLLTKLNLGVRLNGEPDYAFFEELEEQSSRMLLALYRL